MKQLTKNFSEAEFACPCCGQCKMNIHFMGQLQRVRDAYQNGMVPNSAYRCEKHNKALGGAKSSFHMAGRAADFSVMDPTRRWQLVKAAMAAGMTVIVYPTFLHFDDRFPAQFLVKQPSGGFKALLGIPSERRDC